MRLSIGSRRGRAPAATSSSWALAARAVALRAAASSVASRERLARGDPLAGAPERGAVRRAGRGRARAGRGCRAGPRSPRRVCAGGAQGDPERARVAERRGRGRCPRRRASRRAPSAHGVGAPGGVRRVADAPGALVLAAGEQIVRGRPRGRSRPSGGRAAGAWRPTRAPRAGPRRDRARATAARRLGDVVLDERDLDQRERARADHEARVLGGVERRPPRPRRGCRAATTRPRAGARPGRRPGTSRAAAPTR